MIRFALRCASEHEFEGWFSSSDDYDSQSARHLITCPVCDSHDVRKQIMAPALATTGHREFASGEPAMRAMMMEALLGAVDAVVNPAKMGEMGLTPKVAFQQIVAIFLDGVVIKEGGGSR